MKHRSKYHQAKHLERRIVRAILADPPNARFVRLYYRLNRILAIRNARYRRKKGRGMGITANAAIWPTYQERRAEGWPTRALVQQMRARAA